jgi:hypothetical protein
VTDIAAEVRDILFLHLGTDETMITPSVRLVEDLGVAPTFSTSSWRVKRCSTSTFPTTL